MTEALGIPFRAVFICRGAPGLGRVSPSIALYQNLCDAGLEQYSFVSYAAGNWFLSGQQLKCAEIETPLGNFVEPISEGFEKCVRILEEIDPDIVIVDGEPYLLLALNGLGYKTLYLANPHDIFGEQNHFKRMNAQFIKFADQVIVPSLSWEKMKHLSGKGITVTAPLVKRAAHDQPGICFTPSASPHIIVSLGGGVAKSGDTFRHLTESILRLSLPAIGKLCDAGVIGQATVLLGYDSEIKDCMPTHPLIRLVSEAIGLVDILPVADLVVTRGGRNTIAELIYYKKRGLVIALSEDPLRGIEQVSNATLAGYYPNIKTMTSASITQERLESALIEALTLDIPSTDLHAGNDIACSISLQLISAGLSV
jgi:hypothetical protein